MKSLPNTPQGRQAITDVRDAIRHMITLTDTRLNLVDLDEGLPIEDGTADEYKITKVMLLLANLQIRELSDDNSQAFLQDAIKRRYSNYESSLVGFLKTSPFRSDVEDYKNPNSRDDERRGVDNTKITIPKEVRNRFQQKLNFIARPSKDITCRMLSKDLNRRATRRCRDGAPLPPLPNHGSGINANGSFTCYMKPPDTVQRDGLQSCPNFHAVNTYCFSGERNEMKSVQLDHIKQQACIKKMVFLAVFMLGVGLDREVPAEIETWVHKVDSHINYNAIVNLLFAHVHEHGNLSPAYAACHEFTNHTADNNSLDYKALYYIIPH
jgi:hypothetical protein